jgi:hypothetical protein
MKEKARQFWEWFEENCKSYLFLNEVEEETKSKLLTNLLDHLHWYCEHLNFEIGGEPGGKQELIITAEGDTFYFEEVNTLISTAPVMEDWEFIAFVPPRGDAFEFGFEDVTLKASDIWFLPLRDLARPEIVAIKVCTPFYDRLKEYQWLRPAIYKILESVVGEKTFALDIQYVDIGELPPLPSEEGMMQIAQLPKYIDWKKAAHLAMIYLN